MPEDSDRDEPPAPGSPLTPVLGDALSAALRRLLTRSRAELGKAARTSRHRLELRQAQRDLEHFWTRMGKSAYHLVNAGELDHPALRKAMARIDELEDRIDEIRRRERAGD